MLNLGKKIRALRDKKNKYSNSRVVRKKNSERNKKPYPPPPPPFKLNGRSLSIVNSSLLMAMAMSAITNVFTTYCIHTY